MTFSLSEFEPVADRVYRAVAEPEAVNLGLVVGTTGALVVDTGSSPAQGRALREAAQRLLPAGRPAGFFAVAADEVLGVVQPLGMPLPGSPQTAGGVTADRQDVGDPGGGIPADDVTQCGNRGTDAGEVRHRGERGLRGDPLRGCHGAVAGRAAGAIGDRDEGRADPLEPAHGVPECGLPRVVLRWEELEAQGRLRRGEQGRDRRTRGVGSALATHIRARIRGRPGERAVRRHTSSVGTHGGYPRRGTTPWAPPPRP